MIDTDKLRFYEQMLEGATHHFAWELIREIKRLRGLLDEIDDVIYYNDKKAGQVLPVEKPNLELLRDIMMSYTDEAYQIRGDEGGWVE